MVRALLDGRKTQTRRALKTQPELFNLPDGTPCRVGCMQVDRDTENRVWLGSESAGVLTSQRIRFAKGDRLYVRETWRAGASWDETKPVRLPKGVPLDYLATPLDDGPAGKTRVAIHMPRWASRLTLIVTDVRVERLQDCSAADAVAEGLEHPGDKGLPVSCWRDYGKPEIRAWINDPVKSYRSLWDSINGAGAWEANPWVVAVTFTVEKRNIDA